MKVGDADFISVEEVNKEMKKEITSLKRENKKLQKDILNLAKNSGPIKYTEASVNIDYELDDTKRISVGLSGLVGNSSPESAHERLYLESLQSLGNIIEITLNAKENDVEEKE